MNAQESLYMLAMSEYCLKDYETASEYFKKYFSSYPHGTYSEMAEYYVGQSLFMSTPEPRLDQSGTIAAISAFQEYLDVYPDGKMKPTAQKRLFELQDKLVLKELYNARLYYNLGSYFGNCTNGGNNYEACVITSQNALKDYPYSDNREEFARFQDAEDECYGFINEYPDSKERKTAESYIEKCKEYISSHKEMSLN